MIISLRHSVFLQLKLLHSQSKKSIRRLLIQFGVSETEGIQIGDYCQNHWKCYKCMSNKKHGPIGLIIAAFSSGVLYLAAT